MMMMVNENLDGIVGEDGENGGSSSGSAQRIRIWKPISR